MVRDMMNILFLVKKTSDDLKAYFVALLVLRRKCNFELYGAIILNPSTLLFTYPHNSTNELQFNSRKSLKRIIAKNSIPFMCNARR